MREHAVIKYLNCAEGYWYLWPTNINEDDAKANIVIATNNHG